MAKPNPKAKMKRVWIDSQTEEEIRRGINEAKDLSEYDSLSNSAFLRAKEDYLIGINFSRLLSIIFGRKLAQSINEEKASISIGRVMTCVLGMIVSREREIRNFVKTKYYKLNSSFENFTAEWKVNPKSSVFESPKLYNETGFKKEEDAKALIDNYTWNTGAPNFYKLYSEGISFKNNYSPRNSCATGNNEFSGMTSLYTIQNNCTANIYSNNKYFTSIFNLFKNAGYKTSSMHDYTEQYYVRRIIHKNLGSDAYYNVNDLNIPYYNEYKNWASDEDFMNAAMDITLTDTSSPYMLWLTTVSPHQPYNQSSVEGDKYLSITEDSGYSMELRRYMSKLKTFDNSLGILLDRLKASGTLDDTVIVLYGDHYPYGLKNKDISEVLTYDLSDYEVERTPMVIYNTQIKSEVVEKYSSYINLTPTIANLFNLDYDPRYYMGTDVFSDEYLNVVTFADGSWKNNEVFYNAGSGTVKYYTDKEYSTDELIRINNIVTIRMQMSETIIRNNYYNYLDNKINSYKTANEQKEE